MRAVTLLGGLALASVGCGGSVTAQDDGGAPDGDESGLEWPYESGLPVCRSLKEVDSCPTDGACMAVTAQGGDVLDLRMGRFRPSDPFGFTALAGVLIDPRMNAACVNSGDESFNWLLQIDRKNGTLTTGGARRSLDRKTFTFTTEMVSAADLSSGCPGFVGPSTSIDLSPVTVPITFRGDTFDSGTLPRLSVPIFDPSPGVAPILLPLADVAFTNVTLSQGGSCIGSWDKSLWCDGDSLGWKTAGTLTGKLTLEDADHVPIKFADCASLCALLANDGALTTKSNGHYVCKRDADGRIPPIGDANVGIGYHNAYLITATFSAYGVTIVGGR